jgi:hypothetical protein
VKLTAAMDDPTLTGLIAAHAMSSAERGERRGISIGARQLPVH